MSTEEVPRKHEQPYQACHEIWQGCAWIQSCSKVPKEGTGKDDPHL